MRLFTLFLTLLPLTITHAQSSKNFPVLADTAIVLTLDSVVVKANDLVHPNQLTMVVLWNSMMRPAFNELDSLYKVYPEWQKKYGVEIVTVACEFSKSSVNLKKFLAKRDWKYRQYIDLKPYGGVFQIITYPTTYIVDKQGHVQLKTTGFDAAERVKYEDKLREITKQ